MLQKFKDELFASENKWLSVGITDDGEGGYAIPVPWDVTAHAFNMKIPDIYISAEDIFDNEIIDRLCKNNIVGCYIFTPLKDYSFISRFKNLWDIYIRRGENITNLSFLSGLTDCKMLFFQNLTIDSLDAAFCNYNPEGIINGICLGLYNCDIKDISVLEKKNITVYELAVWNEKERIDADRWKNTRILRKNFYPIEV